MCRWEWIRVGLNIFSTLNFDSAPSTDLPIWRVFEGSFPGTPITDEDTWGATWAVVMRLRSERPQLKFNCGQSLYVRETHQVR
jgi:hypothetical protein